MATNINKTDKLLGFTSDTFNLVIRKPKDGSLWAEVELKIGETTQTSKWKKYDASESLAKRVKSTVEAFFKSSFDGLILVGKVVKEKK